MCTQCRLFIICVIRLPNWSKETNHYRCMRCNRARATIIMYLWLQSYEIKWNVSKRTIRRVYVCVCVFLCLCFVSVCLCVCAYLFVHVCLHLFVHADAGLVRLESEIESMEKSSKLQQSTASKCWKLFPLLTKKKVFFCSSSTSSTSDPKTGFVNVKLKHTYTHAKHNQKK